jgi:hypothetical protein
LTHLINKRVATALDDTALLGCWRNLDLTSSELHEITLSTDSNVLGYCLHVLAVGQDEPDDWGKVSTSVYAVKGSDKASGFHGQYSHNGRKTSIAANLNKGIAVVQTYTTLLSGGWGRFSKEYFHRCTAISQDNPQQEQE